jgi:hypothetical protein
MRDSDKSDCLEKERTRQKSYMRTNGLERVDDEVIPCFETDGESMDVYSVQVVRSVYDERGLLIIDTCR